MKLRFCGIYEFKVLENFRPEIMEELKKVLFNTS